MNLENFPRIALYNTNPITLLGWGIQCIYEGSFTWLATATHPLFAGDYYIEDDDYPDPLPESLPDPSSQIPSEQKLVALPVVASNSLLPTYDSQRYVAPTSVAPTSPISPKPLVAIETATLTLMAPNVARSPEKLLSNYETEGLKDDGPSFLRYWGTSVTQDPDRVPVSVPHDAIERHQSVNVSTPLTLPALSNCPSEASTLPSYILDYKEEAQSPHEEPVNLLTLPSPQLEHASWPEQSKHFLSPLKFPAVFPIDSEYPTSKSRKRHSQKFVHILEAAPGKRRHLYKDRTLEQLHEGPLAEEPTVHFHSEYSTAHPYGHHHHRSRHQKSRRKDRIYDREEVDANLVEVPFDRHHESSPPYHLAQLPTPYLRHKEFPSLEQYHRHRQRSQLEEEIHDIKGINAASEAPSPDRRDESPPPENLARPLTPHPRRKKLLSTEDPLYAEADEFLNRMAEELFEVENTARDLKRKERYSSQAGNNAHDTKKARKERRREKKERRSAPYASRSIMRSTSAHEYREPSERRPSKTKKIKGVTAGRKTRKRGTPLDNIGTLGLGTLSFAQPQATYSDSVHLVHSSAQPRSLSLLAAALSELHTSKQAGSREGALQLDSLVAAFPMEQPHLNDGELSTLFQGVQLNVQSEPNEYQNQSEAPSSVTQSAEANRQWNDDEDLGDILTQVQLSNDAPEHERTRT